MGYYYRGQTEHVSVRCPWVAAAAAPGRRHGADGVASAAHSAKPDGFYELIETCSPGPWMDLYARRERPGWLTWGAEV